MKHKKIQEFKKELVEVFSKISNDKRLMSEFLIDITTPSEFDAISLRWQIVKKLSKGETHREVAGDLGLGVSTVTRGSREMRNKKGGFALVLEKFGNK